MSVANDRPLSVTRFEIFMFISFAVGVISRIYDDIFPKIITRSGGQYSVASGDLTSGISLEKIIIQLFGLSIGVFIAVRLTLFISGSRRNAARWCLLVFLLVTIPMNIRVMIRADTMDLIFALVQDTLLLTALILIFQRDAGDWIKSRW